MIKINNTYRVARAYDFNSLSNLTRDQIMETFDSEFVKSVSSSLKQEYSTLLDSIRGKFKEDSYFLEQGEGDIEVIHSPESAPEAESPLGAVATLDAFKINSQEGEFIARISATVCRGPNRSKLWVRLSQQDRQIDFGESSSFSYRSIIENYIRVLNEASLEYYQRLLFERLVLKNQKFKDNESEFSLASIFEMESVATAISDPALNDSMFEALVALDNDEKTLSEIYESNSLPFKFFPSEYKHSDAEWKVVCSNKYVALLKQVFHDDDYTAIGDGDRHLDGMGHYGITFSPPGTPLGHVDVLTSRSPLELYSHHI